MVRRDGAYRDLLRGYEVLIDGRKVGQVRRRQRARYDVTPGPHTVRMRIDWCSSPDVKITVAAGESVTLICEPNGSAARGTVQMLTSPRKYIRLQLDDSPSA
ncbi:hypothetical protein ACIPJS_14760 [Streptomyces sp. NPDC086783]|uniref:hypothetical protein n=1 Tax=Streptomyces sp. NPDC086783 TaxID=3365758 RepID=UPI0037F48A46